MADNDYAEYLALLQREGKSMEALRRAFRKLALKAHPDKPEGSPQKFRALVRAAEKVERVLNGDEDEDDLVNGEPAENDGTPVETQHSGGRFSSGPGVQRSSQKTSGRGGRGSSSSSTSSFSMGQEEDLGYTGGGKKIRRRVNWTQLGSDVWVRSSGGARSTLSGRPTFEANDADNSEESVADEGDAIRLADLQFVEEKKKSNSELWKVGGAASTSRTSGNSSLGNKMLSTSLVAEQMKSKVAGQRTNAIQKNCQCRLM
ncbi:unnamed protein product [Amoebophrya sp. A25]|nr:unnamed protein product [Amoebophrya sp. A25]|eukprot:GSA25T00004394001.1